ncbi:TolC family protein [Arcicella rosea]|uniref:Outer membrane protein TolC n=1 Tax=Arcicella rosea TaxID=502909 RepID=A0A841EWK7_9BACT|nr:TolC family protein [Arcicella rosea]MBB6004700.1 outer membrane protein TolC [Arcicella rosea]
MRIFLKYTVPLACCLLVTGIRTSVAQQQITLSQAIETALKNNLDIQISKNTLNASTINNYIGVAGGLPTVTGTFNTNEQVTGLNQELSNGTSTNRTGVVSNNTNMSVTATMMLYNGGRVMATQKRLEELQKLSQEQLNTSVQNVIADVMLKYFAVVQQQNFVTTLLQSIEVSKQKLSLIEARKSVGLSNEAEFLQASLDLNAQTQALQTQKIVIEQSKADLLRSLVLNPKTVITITDTIELDKSLQWESIETNIKKHPSILSAEAQVNVNLLLEREANARRYPTVNLNTGYNYGRNQSGAGFTLLNQTYGPFLGINASIPIYAGTVNTRQVQVAKINTETARLQKEVIIQNFENTAAKSWEAYSNTLQLIEAEKQNYELADRLLKLMNQRFQLGQATIIDVKQAQQSFENSGYRLNNLSYTAKIAEITLKQIASQLGK